MKSLVQLTDCRNKEELKGQRRYNNHVGGVVEIRKNWKKYIIIPYLYCYRRNKEELKAILSRPLYLYTNVEIRKNWKFSLPVYWDLIYRRNKEELKAF